MAANKIDVQKTGFFRFKRLSRDYLLTNDVGEYIYLKPSSFDRFLTGKLDKGSAEYSRLRDAGFMRDQAKVEATIDKYRQKNAFLGVGTSLHIIVVTLRCDHMCIYCHASARNVRAAGLDMDCATAKQVVDRIFESPNPYIIIEFQGGEPLLNFDTLKFIIEYAQEKNKTFRKKLMISMVTNLGAMNTSRLNYLCRKKISICTSLDGPEGLHNQNRKALGNINSYQHTVKWFRQIEKAYSRRVNYKLNALTTITRHSLPYPREIVDTYLKLGCNSIHLRNLNPFGLAKKSWEKVGYSADEFLAFYKKALDYILELNLKGVFVYERLARVFLMKIFGQTDPGYFELRSPCGAGIGQLAYNYNGDVYTCDEARMLSRMGDDAFKLGNVRENNYQDFIASGTLKAVCSASVLDTLPGCASCAYKPYCGVCPIYNYVQNGNIFTQSANNERCKINMAVLDYLFDKLRESKTEKILKRWADGERGRRPSVALKKEKTDEGAL